MKEFELEHHIKIITDIAVNRSSAIYPYTQSDLHRRCFIDGVRFALSSLETEYIEFIKENEEDEDAIYLEIEELRSEIISHITNTGCLRAKNDILTYENNDLVDKWQYNLDRVFELENENEQMKKLQSELLIKINKQVDKILELEKKLSFAPKIYIEESKLIAQLNDCKKEVDTLKKCDEFNLDKINKLIDEKHSLQDEIKELEYQLSISSANNARDSIYMDIDVKAKFSNIIKADNWESTENDSYPRKHRYFVFINNDNNNIYIGFNNEDVKYFYAYTLIDGTYTNVGTCKNVTYWRYLN